jgi:hypothetical protein
METNHLHPHLLHFWHVHNASFFYIVQMIADKKTQDFMKKHAKGFNRKPNKTKKEKVV